MIHEVFDSSSSRWQMAELPQFHCGEKQTRISGIILHRHSPIFFLHLQKSALSDLLEPLLADTDQGQGDTLDESPLHRRVTIGEHANDKQKAT